MTKEELAELLNGRQYRHEITDGEAEQANKDGLVVVFGASDDLIEIRGAITDEIDAYDSSFVSLYRSELKEYCDCNCFYYKQALALNKLIDIYHTGYFMGKDRFWEYSVDIPFSHFYIFEGSDPYCKGIIFDIKDIA